MDHRLHIEGLKALTNHRMLFADKMDTFPILNTNIISKRLHLSTKQQIERSLNNNGEFHANCQLLDSLRKLDSGAADLLQAFRETNYKGPHRELALILQKAMHTSRDSDGSNSTSSALASASPSTSPSSSSSSSSGVFGQKLSPDERTLPNPVQETEKTDDITTTIPQQSSRDENETALKMTTKRPKCPVNQLSELTSAQHDIQNNDSTSCNETKPEFLSPSKKSQININKSHILNDKVERNKEMEALLLDSRQMTASMCQEEENNTPIQLPGLPIPLQPTQETLPPLPQSRPPISPPPPPPPPSETATSTTYLTSATASEPMSESFVIGDSQIRRAFCEETDNNIEHEIEDLKCSVDTNDNDNSKTLPVRKSAGINHSYEIEQTLPKKESNGVECSNGNEQTIPKEESHEVEYEQTYLKEVSCGGTEDNDRNETKDEKDTQSVTAYSRNFIDVHTKMSESESGTKLNSLHFYEKDGTKKEKRSENDAENYSEKTNQPSKNCYKNDSITHSFPAQNEANPLHEAQRTANYDSFLSSSTHSGTVNTNLEPTTMQSATSLTCKDNTALVDGDSCEDMKDENLNAENADPLPLSFNTTSDTVPSIDRLQSCPAKIELNEETSGQFGERGSNANSVSSHNTMPLDRSKSVPAEGVYFGVFNKLCIKRRASVCKGIAGNF